MGIFKAFEGASQGKARTETVNVANRLVFGQILFVILLLQDIHLPKTKLFSKVEKLSDALILFKL